MARLAGVLNADRVTQNSLAFDLEIKSALAEAEGDNLPRSREQREHNSNENEREREGRVGAPMRLVPAAHLRHARIIAPMPDRSRERWKAAQQGTLTTPE